jgi:hypothetical protein
LALSAQAPAQKRTAPATAVVFAVLYNGGTLEPIAYIDGGRLVAAIDGGSDPADLKAFHTRYYKRAAKYPLIFGGANAGTVAVKSSDPASECAKHTADVAVTSSKAKINGNVMGLATDLAIKKPGTGVRRMPTPKERAEIEDLVRAEFRRQKVSAAAVKNLKYQNLTAIDVDSDGTAEMVGSFWVEPAAKTRALLFFIAEKDADGKYVLDHSEFESIAEADTMGGEIAIIDRGVYHELLLDSLDIDGDGVAEIFTFEPAFEGSTFNAYRREKGKWTRIFEGSNYRCAF